MTKTVEKSIIESVSDLDLDGAFALPAINVNRFVVALSPTNVRLSFGEEYGQEKKTTNFRSSVIMSFDDAQRLVQAITEMLQKTSSSTKP